MEIPLAACNTATGTGGVAQPSAARPLISDPRPCGALLTTGDPSSVIAVGKVIQQSSLPVKSSPSPSKETVAFLTMPSLVVPALSFKDTSPKTVKSTPTRNTVLADAVQKSTIISHQVSVVDDSHAPDENCAAPMAHKRRGTSIDRPSKKSRVAPPVRGTGMPDDAIDLCDSD